ncbi:MAG: imidazole glycerol phosphate synthase subunit HisH [Nitrospina sp.]|mgnify:FL=1|nr:imidazole glycerol phosphate synthase subunit HisH [Nitrospina sp.]MBT3509818.1 imidazole glycerol phosphate synthase subunit HisH [Nitrospina sp.]MBT3876206.1 imidazole glycerol phosphate synthase subunit HisH [Nitrospina sp.]MBT4049816.1 imidazole glycerol phosphate synthase subunit HisH [Nitrospina sp.]MBT4558702.1 imidazole glycerol phosphate synthase subunit HisH [Nitrospina sp.]
MIAIIDYGMGNLRSVQKGFEAVGAEAIVTSDSSKILSANSVVLPGVGAFKECMANLDNLNLIDTVHKSVNSGKPFLGICLGLQLLFSQAEEFGKVEGLGILSGKVVGFKDAQPKSESGEPLKIPHMGWNRVRVAPGNPLFESVADESYFYFVHSYYVIPQDPAIIATTTSYGIDFASGVHFENVHAFQFHPEKSQRLGLTMLKNFSQLH